MCNGNNSECETSVVCEYYFNTVSTYNMDKQRKILR